MKYLIVFSLVASLFYLPSAKAAALGATIVVGAVSAGADASSYGANCMTGKCQSALISKELSDEMKAEQLNSDVEAKQPSKTSRQSEE